MPHRGFEPRSPFIFLIRKGLVRFRTLTSIETTIHRFPGVNN
ncbi:hypothetical protein VPHD479_0384 [Vibrio phage D479]